MTVTSWANFSQVCSQKALKRSAWRVIQGLSRDLFFCRFFLSFFFVVIFSNPFSPREKCLGKKNFSHQWKSSENPVKIQGIQEKSRAPDFYRIGHRASKNYFLTKKVVKPHLMDLFCTFFNRSARFHFSPDPWHPSDWVLLKLCYPK